MPSANSYATGAGDAAFRQLMTPANNGSVDFMAFARGAAMADELNWRDHLRQLDYDRLGRTRQDETDERQARTYMASLLTNMQTAASAGVDPTDFYIQQREQMLGDPAFQSMSPEVQNMVINRLGHSLALHAQSLKNAGNATDLKRVLEAYGLVSPVTGAAAAGMAGDYARQIDAVNQQFGSNIQLSPDGQTVSFNGMSMPAHAAIAELNRAGNRPDALQAVMYQYQTNSEYRDRLNAAYSRQGLDEFGFPIGGAQYGGMPVGTGVPANTGGLPAGTGAPAELTPVPGDTKVALDMARLQQLLGSQTWADLVEGKGFGLGQRAPTSGLMPSTPSGGQQDWRAMMNSMMPNTSGFMADPVGAAGSMAGSGGFQKQPFTREDLSLKPFAAIPNLITKAVKDDPAGFANSYIKPFMDAATYGPHVPSSLQDIMLKAAPGEVDTGFFKFRHLPDYGKK